MARKSQYWLPNPATGVKEKHHLETELAQIEDMTAFMRTLNTKEGALAARQYLGVGYRRRTRKSFALADMIAAVASGDYCEYDIEPGDYYNGASGYTYIFAGDNPMKGTHEYTITQNHAGLVVCTHATSPWNSSGDTTAGGYVSSTLHSFLVNTVLPKVISDLGAAHLIAHHKLYSNAVESTFVGRIGGAYGASSNWAWYADQYISALTEMQVYGSTIWSSSGYDTGEADQQLDVFRRFKHTDIFGNEYPWLRGVVSSAYAAYATIDGHATIHGASHAFHVAGLIAFH